MRRNTKKFKPNASKTSRHSIRSSSIRDIIGDRRFNHQFGHINTHGTEEITKVKGIGDAEADDLPNLGRKASSSECEAAEDSRGCCVDFAAKTSEYAFFKRMKGTTSSNTHVHPKYHDNQLNNVQQTDHSTREEIPNVQKESFKHARSSLPLEKEENDTHYAFLTPIIGSKNSDANNVLGNVEKLAPGEYNWLSPSMGSKTKTSANKGVFSMKREKLRQMVTDKSLYDVNELSSEGFDLVSVLMSRLLPKDQENNCKDETNSKYKLIKNHQANKRKLIESHHISYLDDDLPRSSQRHLEWNPNGSEPSFINHAQKSSIIQYDRYHPEAYKKNWIKSQNISYMDDDFPKSPERVTDMDLLEWNHNHSESSISSIQYDCFPRSLEWNPNPTRSELFPKSGYFKELEDFYFDYEPKLLSQSQSESRPLLLEWEDNSQKDEFQTTFLTSLTSQDDDCRLFMNIDRHLEDHHLGSSIIPYTPKHVEEDLPRVVHSLDENGNNFLCGPDGLSECKVKGYDSCTYMECFFDDEDFDRVRYPLLLCDSRENEFSV